jgi:cytochrome c oxidase subunit 2
MLMKRTRLHKWLWRAAALVLAVLPLQIVSAHGPSDGGANRSDIDGLFTIIFFLALPIFLLVEGLILFAIIRYRRRRTSESPKQVEGNRPLELAWTIISFVIVGVLFVLTYRFMTTEYDAEADNEEGTPDLTVHVTGYMFDWDYEYFLGEGEETGVQTTRKLTVRRTADPANHGLDVSAVFGCDLAGKVDAIGYTNSIWLKVDDRYV